MLNHNNGFTLIEVLVAIIIFSFSIATIYWGYSQGIKNTKKALDLIHEFNLARNFYLLNKKTIIEGGENNIQNENFIVEKEPLSVMINDVFKLENENIFIIKVQDVNNKYEFKFVDAK